MMTRVCFSPDSLPLFSLQQPSGFCGLYMIRAGRLEIGSSGSSLYSSHKIANRRRYSMASEVSLHCCWEVDSGAEKFAFRLIGNTEKESLRVGFLLLYYIPLGSPAYEFML